VLKGYADKVYAICSRSDLDEKLLRQLEAAEIQVIEKKIIEIIGESTVNKIIFNDDVELPIDGLFIELGAKSSLELIGHLGVLFDEHEFIITDKEQKTNIDGVYAAGDICGPPFQVAKAIGEGCVAGINAANYAKN
jgi:thioredoxin reductase (NADPH)